MGRPYAATPRRAVRVSRERRGLSAIAPTSAFDSVERRTSRLVRPIRILSRETFIPSISYLPSVCGSCTAQGWLADLGIPGFQSDKSGSATAAGHTDCHRIAKVPLILG